MKAFSGIAQQLQHHPLMQRAQQRWQQFAPREQRLLQVLAAVLGVAVVYFLIWQPSQQARLQAEQRLQAQQQQLLWVQQNIARYQALAARQQERVEPASGSLTQRLNQAAEAQDIRLARMQPQGEGMVVSVDEASFSQVLQLVAQLEQQYQLRVETLDVARLDTPGQVRVRQLLVMDNS